MPENTFVVSLKKEKNEQEDENYYRWCYRRNGKTFSKRI
jgi:hypothetical protein